MGFRRNRASSKAAEPRSLRFTFSVSTTSDKPADDVMAEIKKALDAREIHYEQKETYLMNCLADDVNFEIEVCKLPRLGMNGLRLKRVSGNSWAYKSLCTELIGVMD